MITFLWSCLKTFSFCRSLNDSRRDHLHLSPFISLPKKRQEVKICKVGVFEVLKCALLHSQVHQTDVIFRLRTVISFVNNLGTNDSLKFQTCRFKLFILKKNRKMTQKISFENYSHFLHTYPTLTRETAPFKVVKICVRYNLGAQTPY